MGWVPQWAKDTYHFTRSMIDPHYIEPAFRAPAGKTQAERDAQKAEANRYTASSKKIAANIETGVVTTVDVLGTTAGSLTPVPGATFIVPAAVEIAADSYLASQGEAPLRTAASLILPNSFGGDAHYKSGGTADDHPDRIAYRKKMQEQVLANSQQQAASTGQAGGGTSPQKLSGEGKSDENSSQAAFFGPGSAVVGALLGVIGLLVTGGEWITGLILAVVGVVVGQTLFNVLGKMNESAQPPATSTARSEEPKKPDVAQQIVVAPPTLSMHNAEIAR